MDDLDLAYAAGIMDGEGTIGISEYKPDAAKRRRSPHFRPYVTVSMTDPNVPVWLAEMFGGTVHCYSYKPDTHKPFHMWRVSNQGAARVCGLLVPFLKVKRQQAELVLGFYADPRFVFKQRQGIPPDEIEARREYVADVQRLNRRGA